MSCIQTALAEQYAVALDRKVNGGGEKSYTAYLYDQGLDKILKKLGEECFEACIAFKNDDEAETVGELNDVLYHLTVLLCQSGVSFNAVMDELCSRCKLHSGDIADAWEVIGLRRTTGDAESYTAYLFRSGLDKILKKVGEACANLLISGKAGDTANIAQYSGDLVFHLLCAMQCKEISLDALCDEQDKRAGKTGNRKQVHRSDHTT